MRKVLIPVFGAMALACGGLAETDYGDCPAYLDCAENMGMPTADLHRSYGEAGDCWDEDRRECRAACTEGLESTCPDGVPDCTETLVATGNGVGQVAEDFSVPTQNPGETFRLHEHCSSVVMLVTSTTWDPHINWENIEITQQYYEGQGFEVVALMGQNEDGFTYPSQEDLKAFADENGLSFTVAEDVDSEIYLRFTQDFTIPGFTLIERGSVVHTVDDESGWDAIGELL